MPRRAKTKPKRAADEAMRMSIGSVMVTPTPTAGAVDRGDHRLAALEEAQRHQAAAVAVRLDRLRRAAVVERAAAAAQVGAGAEAAPGAGDDDGAHVIVGVGAIEGGDHLAAHALGERVQLVRAGAG